MGSTVQQIQRRAGENIEPPFRTGRFFCVGNRWYFSTREGFDSGPYQTKERAELGLDRFLKVAKVLPKTNRNRPHFQTSSNSPAASLH